MERRSVEIPRRAVPNFDMGLHKVSGKVSFVIVHACHSHYLAKVVYSYLQALSR
jgi:hypothetical protein